MALTMTTMTPLKRLLVQVGVFIVLPLLVAGGFFTAVALKGGEKVLTSDEVAAESCGTGTEAVHLKWSASPTVNEIDRGEYASRYYETSDGRGVFVDLATDDWQVSGRGCTAEVKRDLDAPMLDMCARGIKVSGYC